MTFTQEQITTIINALAILAGAISVWLTGRKVAFKVDEDKAETTRASAKVDDLKAKADDIHVLVNNSHEAQEQRLKDLFATLLSLSEKRVEDQKEAVAKVADAMKTGVTVVPIDRRRDNDDKG